MNCPKCNNSEMWDNRVNKRNPKGPDYRCKDKDCGHAIWIDAKPKKGEAKPNGYTAKWTGSQLAQLYGWAFLHAGHAVVEFAKLHKVGFTVGEAVQATATLFIAATNHSAPKAKTVKAPEPPLNEPPPQLADDDDDLPFD